MECVRGEMTHFKERQLSKLLCLPSEKRSTLKGKNLLPFAHSYLLVFRRRFMYRKANKKS